MIVSVEGLTKRYAVRRSWRQLLRSPLARPERALAVDDVSFTVDDGEIFGLLGQNGAGKSTLFRMLCTLVTPDVGAARVGGYDVVHDGDAVRQLLAPVIANERSLNWRLSARENLRLYATLQGLYGGAGRAEESRVLGITGLADTGEKMVGEFSSGMRQRLLIARALIGRPRVLLLDEPTRSLDAVSARDFRRFLRDVVVRAEGCTVLLATHAAEEVWDLCDRVGVLHRGRLLAVDATARMRHRAGSDRFSVWIRATAAAAVVTRATAGGVMLQRRGPSLEDGWDEFTCDISGGMDAAARALALVSTGGADIARFTRAAPSLADLIERVVATSGAGATVA